MNTNLYRLLLLCIIAFPSTAMAQVAEGILIEVAVDSYNFGLVEDSKRMLLKIRHDPSSTDDMKAQALWILGRIAQDEGDVKLAFDTWTSLLQSYPDHPAAAQASRAIDRLFIEAQYLQLASGTWPAMWVRNEVEVGEIKLGRKKITIKGIGIYYANPLPVHIKLIELTSESFWGDRRVLINTTEIPIIEEAIMAIQDVETKWGVRKDQRGGAYFETRDGMLVAFVQEETKDDKPKPAYGIDKDDASQYVLNWFFMFETRRIDLQEGVPAEFVLMLKRADEMIEALSPAAWFEK